MTGQVKFGLVKSDRSSRKKFEPKIVWAQILFGTKMHLSMEFDSGVGPTCFTMFSEIGETMNRSSSYHNLLDL